MFKRSLEGIRVLLAIAVAIHVILFIFNIVFWKAAGMIGWSEFFAYTVTSCCIYAVIYLIFHKLNRMLDLFKPIRRREL